MDNKNKSKSSLNTFLVAGAVGAVGFLAGYLTNEILKEEDPK